ncbi:hypothetical protein G6F70_005065 [Rhizopus microsporus]|uniref:Uncharacterized protein n=2 Tax=Rhizopus TaxID=4842 RepID=A0A367K121_RHIAZ|nr:hypothetical protein G6F71_003359 [Rhizopus microsporus]RCH95847.1 hypothetical protein CU097_006317 [Rhizopus azygosporus]KAG1199272.1 hypothetical protein G6F70_005065 [Rhizopus microsporus]KAG1213031.1 hypothetical protein G6F69_003178 [Rhizopus microsporus]KAG1235020.1 hypothetical protein G6F67_003081 [Rhizopus microsporus]
MSMKKPNDLPLRRVTRSMVNKNTTKQKSNLKDLLKLTKAQESLMSACSENDVSTVVALLEKHKPHLDPDRIRDSKLRTPLLIASAKGNTEIVKVLIQWGADVNNPMGDIVGNRPLHLAVASNNVDTVLALLEAGAQTRPDESRVINSDDGLPSLVRNQLRAPLELATSRLNMLMKQANTRNRTQSLSQVTKVMS